VDVRAGGLPRWPEAKQNRGERRERKGERHHAPVEPDSFEARGAGRSESNEGVASPNRKNQTEGAADDGDDKTFNQELPDNLAAGSAHRRANRELPSTCGPTH